MTAPRVVYDPETGRARIEWDTSLLAPDGERRSVEVHAVWAAAVEERERELDRLHGLRRADAERYAETERHAAGRVRQAQAVIEVEVPALKAALVERDRFINGQMAEIARLRAAVEAARALLDAGVGADASGEAPERTALRVALARIDAPRGDS